MFDIDFKTEDGKKYEIFIIARHFDDPDEKGFEMKIDDIVPFPPPTHLEVIQGEWLNHGTIYERAADRAYLELEEHQC